SKVFYRKRGSSRLSYIGGSCAKMDSQFRSMRLHVAYLRSLEDSDRVRAACVKYLQNGLVLFCPERPDIVEQAHRLPGGPGGRLEIPRLPRKYAWIGDVLGPDTARRAQLALPRVRSAAARFIDKIRSPFA